VTSPVWSATHAAPAAASAINTKNKIIRIMEILLTGPGEHGHGIGRKLARGGKRGIARIGLVEPGLRGRAIGGRKRVQFAPRIGKIVAQRRRRGPRDNGAAIIAGRIGALDADQLRRAGLQAFDDAGAGARTFRRRRQFGTSVNSSRLSNGAFGTPVAAKASSGFSASGLGLSDFAVAINAGKGWPC